jgi:hypothetical protein
MRDRTRLSEALTGNGGAIFRRACGLGLQGIVFEASRLAYVSG